MRWIDLSYPIDGHAPVYPGTPPVKLEQAAFLERDHYCGYRYSGVLHVGTHVDAPMHMLEDSRFIGDWAPEAFCGPGCLLDVRGRDVLEVEPGMADRIPEAAIVLLMTGWEAQYGTPAYYQEHPVLSDGLVELLLERRIRMLGMDMPSPDRFPFNTHRRLLGAGIFILENVRGLEALLDVPAFEVMALPLRIAAEGSPVRAVARID